MNDTLDYKISVMQAYRAGEKIESRFQGWASWIFNDSPKWNWEQCDYRVKAQEPRRALVSIGKNGEYFNAYSPINEQMLIGRIRSDDPDALVEFIELTPEIKQKLGL